MKRTLTGLLILETIGFILLELWGNTSGRLITTLFAFPFEQIGMGLRFLSISGTAGNICAVTIYIGISLSPIFYLSLRARKNTLAVEDGLLILLTLVLFPVIYFMVNPAYLVHHFGHPEFLEMAKSFLGITVYSILSGYVTIRVLRLISMSQANSMLKYMKYLLGIICIFLIYGIFGSGFTELISQIENLKAANTAIGQALTLSEIFLVLQYIVNQLPLLFEIVVIYSGMDLISALEQDEFDDAIASVSKRTGDICRYSIAIIMLTQIGINVLQLALGSRVLSSYYSLSMPLMSIVFVLSAMFIAHYFEQTKQIKDENDRFI